MTVSREVEVEVRRLYYAEHWKVGTIATQLSVHGWPTTPACACWRAPAK